MQKNDCTLRRLIELALELELRAYQFYDTLEKNFQDNSEFVYCLRGVKEDEQLHYRILTEIKQSLSEVRLNSPVTEDSLSRVIDILSFLDALDVESLFDEEKAVDAIQKLEAIEFDVVMEFVGAEEIDFEFTREYLKNESLDHASRIFKAQQCLD